MGFLDSISTSLNRGVNTVSRSGKTAQLNMQLNELMKQRQGLAAQLGASLYDQTKDNPQFTVGREGLYNGIASIDAQRASIELQIQQIRAEQAAATAAAQTYRCPRCGSTVAATDMFCSGCGLSIEQVKAGQAAAQPMPAAMPQAVQGGRRCPQCGAPLAPGDVFCMNCGHRVDAPAAPAAQPDPAVTPAPSAPVPAANDAPQDQDVRRCPYCGALLGPDDVFCMSCGRRVDEKTEPAAQPAPDDAPVQPAETTQAAEPAAPVAPAEAPEAAPADATPEPAFAVRPDVPEALAEPSEPAPAEAAPEEAAAAEEPGERRCPHCGALLGPDDVFCMSCGNRVNEQAEPASDDADAEPVETKQEAVPAVPDTPAEAASQEPEVRLCPNCGAVVGPDEKYCFSCGNKLS